MDAIDYFKDVVGYEGLYKVSDDGMVVSVERHVIHSKGGMAKKQGITLSQKATQSGHLRVPLWKECKSSYKYVHRLVAEAFIGPRPVGMECCHNDGNPSNNEVGNLRWDTHVNNLLDRDLHGTAQKGEHGNGAILTDAAVVEIRLRAGEYRGVGLELASKYGVSPATISKVKLGQAWSHIHV